ncbi:MAG: thiamine pyrophosphate-dependent enzyme [Gammaproteobacteria bacterium]|nr:thiamine pyrophosphate-dependent enzyme [Gammaproteobacteria bacterium]
MIRIRRHQMKAFDRPSHIDFNNPDFVKYAESFDARGCRVESAQDLMPTLKRAVDDNTVVIIDCPVDCSENIKLTEKLGGLVCPI